MRARFIERILVKLLRKYTKELRTREVTADADVPGPLKRTKTTSYWQEGTTLSAIRDPYVRVPTTDLQPLYDPIVESSTQPGDVPKDRKRTHDQLEEDSDGTLEFDEDQDTAALETPFRDFDEAAEDDQNYLSVTKLVLNYQYQDRNMDYNYDEYEFVAEFAAKIVGLDKLEMMRIAISLEHFICTKTRSKFEP